LRTLQHNVLQDLKKIIAAAAVLLQRVSRISGIPETLISVIGLWGNFSIADIHCQFRTRDSKQLSNWAWQTPLFLKPLFVITAGLKTGAFPYTIHPSSSSDG
jgi:hypothetical protein